MRLFIMVDLPVFTGLIISNKAPPPGTSTPTLGKCGWCGLGLTLWGSTTGNILGAFILYIIIYNRYNKKI